MASRHEDFSGSIPNLVKEYENEYESMIKRLYDQIDLYKTEYNSMRVEMTKLINENNELSNRLKTHVEINNSKGEDATKHTYNRNDLHGNLLKQLEILSKEKETALNLWQESLKTIDHLESELKVFEGQTHGYISQEDFGKAQQSYLKRIGLLEQKISDLQKENSIQKETYEMLTKQKTFGLEGMMEKEKISCSTIKELEAEKLKFQAQLEEIAKINKELEVASQTKDKTINDLRNELLESKCKVAEACQVVDAALLEKDAALMREQQAREQIEEMTKKWTESVNETKETVRKDLEAMKVQYQKKMKIIYQEKVQMNEQIKEKDGELERLNRECKILGEEMERLKKGNVIVDDNNTSKLLSLEKHFEATFQKLMLSEKKCLQIEAERDSIKMDLEQMANSYERDVRNRDLEKKMLENKVENLQQELKLSNVQLKDVAEHVKVLNGQIKSIDVDIREKFYRKEMETKKAVGKINQTHAKMENELHKNLDAQSVLNKRWQSEVKDITAKFEERLRQLKKETIDLKKENKKMRHDLLVSDNKLLQYENKCKKLESLSNIAMQVCNN